MTRLAGIDDPGVAWAGARVLVRADLNAPIEDGRVTEDTRIRASVPTLEHLLAAGAGVAVCSHLGRPKGRRDEAFTLKPCAERLGRLMGRTVELLPDCVLDTEARTMGSEDMAFMMQEVPGCYFFIGSANGEKGLDAPHHHPRFDFDERALLRGAGLMAAAAFEILGNPGQEK